MAKKNKTLEDKVSKLHTAMENLGAKFSPLVEALGFTLSYGESKVGLRDITAPKKEKNKYCLVAYICEVSGGPKLEPAVLEHLKKYVFKDEFEGFKLYVAGSGPIIPYLGRIEELAPAYGVPMPKSERIPAGYRDLHPREDDDEDIEGWEKQHD